MPNPTTLILAHFGKSPVDYANPEELELHADLGADSLDGVVIAMELEDTFGVEIHDHDLERLGGGCTVGELAGLVREASA